MTEIRMIPVEQLRPHPENPRKELGDLTELTESIKATGVLQNLTVITSSKPDLYVVLIGHRRLAAAIRAGVKEVPCRVVEKLTPLEQLGIMMAENVQRHDLTTYEQLRGVGRMVQLGMELPDIARVTGIREKTVRRDARLAQAFQQGSLKTATDRGISIPELIELEAIEDPEVRDAVLRKYGEGYSYGNAKSEALYEQRSRAFRARWLEKIAGLPIQEMRKESDRYSNLWDSVIQTSAGNLEKLKIPPLDPARTYAWWVSGESAGIYVYNEQQAEIRRRNKDEQKRRDVMITDATELNMRCRAMRRDFVRRIDTGSREEQCRANLLILDTIFRKTEPAFRFQYGYDWTAVYDMMGLESSTLTEDEKQNLWLAIDNRRIPHRRAAAAVAVALCRWNGDLVRVEHGRFVPAPAAVWGQVYGILLELGYTISPLEQALMDGTAEIYSRNREDDGEVGA